MDEVRGDESMLMEMSRNCTVGYFEAFYRGYRVPNLTIYRVPVDAENRQVYDEAALDPPAWRWELSLDGRWSFDFESREEIERLVPILADGMAVAAGYACHGSNNRLNAHGPTVLGAHVDTPDGEVRVG